MGGISTATLTRLDRGSADVDAGVDLLSLPPREADKSSLARFGLGTGRLQQRHVE